MEAGWIGGQAIPFIPRGGGKTVLVTGRPHGMAFIGRCGFFFLTAAIAVIM
jgi:hypothetical protein